MERIVSLVTSTVMSEFAQRVTVSHQTS